MSDDEDLTFALGTLRGLRCWQANGVWPPWSLSGTYGGVWQPGVNIAHCGRGCDHRVPSRSCRCGFYAYWSPRRARVHNNGNVIGIIDGYGKYRLGTLGFRCEKARIVALCPVRDDDSRLCRKGPSIAQHYGAVWYPNVRAMLRAQPVRTPRGNWWRRLIGWVPVGAGVGAGTIASLLHSPTGPLVTGLIITVFLYMFFLRKSFG